MSVKKFAVIGHPIGHTMSPFIHKRLFELSGVDAEYGVIDVAPENIENDYNNILKSLDGYNITIPHKQAIIPLLNDIDSKAKMYGSVNTVANRDGKATGYTTDPDGFLKALEYAGIPLDGRVVVLGCGGVARTFAYEVLLKGTPLEFAIRAEDREMVEKLISEINSTLDSPKVSYCTIPELSGDITTLINATPIGMSPKSDAQPVSDEVIAKSANVFDAVYNPLETVLIKKAKANGSRAQGGMSMLVWQAVVSHYHWDGSTYNADDIERLCLDAARELMNR
ncbi:MAG: shikimate dehydrogenase [Ruminococcus sp.]|nr:shikimate dehydrogenase [Ruminococcus sp.]